MKKFITYILFITNLFFLIACSNNEKSKLEENNEDFTITVVSTTDIHGYGLTPTDKHIGFNRLSGYVNLLRKEEKEVLLLDAGDIFAGNAISNLDKGKGTIEALNVVKYDGGTMGNHAIDFGYERLLELKNEMKYPFIVSNVFYNNELIFEPYKIVTIKGVNIALVGICTPEFGASEFFYEDPIITMKRLMPELEKKSDIIIVIAHLGQERKYNSTRLAKEILGIDLIIDGHDHISLEEGRRVGNTLIVNSGSEMEKIGITNLVIKNNKVSSSETRLIDMTDKKLADANDLEVNQILKNINKKASEILKKPIVNSPVNLIGNRDIIRKEDTNLGRLVADAFKEDAKADLALINSGWIRSGAKAGIITMEDILNILSMGGNIITISMKGEDIIAGLELSFSIYPEINGNFMQVSGINFDVDPYEKIGEKISNIFINGKPLETDKEYKVAVHEFLTILSKNPEFSMYNQEIISINSFSAEALANYIKNNPEAFENIEQKRIKIN